MKLEELKKKIAGDIVYGDFQSSMKTWRKTFRVSQTELARQLKVSPSVLSDYEKGRRKSPGIRTVQRMIDALIEIDSQRGSPTANTLSMLRHSEKTNGIVKIVEFQKPVSTEAFCRDIGARLLVDFPSTIHGCTVIDSERAIVEMSAEEFIQFFGESPDRAFVFTNVRSGKPVMVAVKVGRLYARMLKPRLIVLHKPSKVSTTAVRIAEAERISLATTEIPIETLLDTIK